MTQFKTIPISKIKVNRDNRQRRDLGDLISLQNSISRIGIIHPLVLNSDFSLIAGERRYTAALNLGLSQVPVQFKSELSEIEREQIELDENIRRLDLSWQDKCSAIARWHSLAIDNNGESWRAESTAEHLGYSEKYIYKQLRVADELASGNERIENAQQFSVAYGIVERSDARKRDSEVEKVETLISTAPSTQQQEEVDYSTDLAEAPIICTDFIEWSSKYSGPKFNFLHCDFPYGVSADKHDQGAADKMGGYEDSADVYFELIRILAQSMKNVVADSAHLMFWFSYNHYADTKRLLRDMGWRVNPTPLIWLKSDNTGILPDPRRMPRQIYEAAFLCSQGDRFLVGAKANAFAAPTTKNYHMSEKSLPMLTHFFSMLVDDTTRFLDPTCGSGNSLIAASHLNAKEILGIEKDEEFYNGAIRNWNSNVKDI